MKKALLSALLLGATALMAADGAAIYKKCVACHGADGKMVYANKVPAQAGKDKAYLIEAMKGYRDGKLNKYGMGAVMQAQAKIHLKDDAAIEAVADYMANLPK